MAGISVTPFLFLFFFTVVDFRGRGEYTGSFASYVTPCISRILTGKFLKLSDYSHAAP